MAVVGGVPAVAPLALSPIVPAAAPGVVTPAFGAVPAVSPFFGGVPFGVPGVAPVAGPLAVTDPIAAAALAGFAPGVLAALGFPGVGGL